MNGLNVVGRWARAAALLVLAFGAATTAAAGAPPEHPALPPFVAAPLDAAGRLIAAPGDADTYILKALDQGGWYRRLLAFPGPHSVAISTATLRVGGSWGRAGTPEEALRACGGEASGCRLYLDRDVVVWRPRRDDPVPADLVPAPTAADDTGTLEGLLTGSLADEARCVGQADAVWVEVAGQQACLRYRAGGLGIANPTALLLLDGDEVYPLYGRDRKSVTGVAAIGTMLRERDAWIAARVAAIADPAGLPYIVLKRPGTGGSSGNQWRAGKTQGETALLDAALDALARRYGIQRWTLAGQSGGAAAVANLVARRQDVACAVLGSGPLSLAAQLAFQGADGMVLPDLDDPLAHVAAIAPDPGRRLVVLSDEIDGLVPLTVQRPWVERASGRGIAVEHRVRRGWGGGPMHHDLTWRAVEAASACAAGEGALPRTQLAAAGR
jgi:pimeloyl-ACP methyl ester carboxylesterase